MDFRPRSERYRDLPTTEQFSIPGWQMRAGAALHPVGLPVMWKPSSVQPEAAMVPQQPAFSSGGPLTSFQLQEQDHQWLQSQQSCQQQQQYQHQALPEALPLGSTEEGSPLAKRKKTDMLQKSKTKSPSFSEKEIEALLDIWSSPEVFSQIRKTGVKKHIWEKIANEMAKLGYSNRTGEQYKEKMRALEKKYKALKEQLNRSGEGNDTSSFPYFEILDSVMGTNPSVRPHHLIDSGDIRQQQDDIFEENWPPSTPAAQSSHSRSDTPSPSDIDQDAPSSSSTRTATKQIERGRKGQTRDGNDFARVVEKSLSSMEERFTAMFEQQMAREERLLEERIRAEREQTRKQQEFFLEAMNILKQK